MIQLVKPDFTVEGVIGECLSYARRVFGAPAGTEYAHQAWINAKYKHQTSEPIPSDVSVLMWYDYYVGTLNEGHVTINDPGIGIYSSPWQKGTTHAVLNSVAQVEQLYRVKYVGWSEDINGVRVVEEDEVKPTYQQVLDVFRSYLGRDCTADEQNYYVTQDFRVLYAFALESQNPSWPQLIATQNSTDFAPYVLPQLFVKKG